MKKFFKILGITFASLLGVAIVAIAAVVLVVFSPKYLTPIVDKVAKNYITCDYQIDQVELTFFSTFPEFGLKTGRILVVNPTEGAQSDTLLMADKLVARVELKQLLKEGCLNLREVGLLGVQANAFIAEDGHTNFDVLSLPSDTTEEDTTAVPFIRSVKIEDLRINMDAARLSLLDLQDTISATLHDVDISLRADTKDSVYAGRLNLVFPRLSANYKGVDYATDADVRLDLPFRADIGWTDKALDVEHVRLELEDAQLSVNQFVVKMSGKAALLPEVEMDLHLNTNTWVISEVLKIVPKELFALPEEIRADGKIGLRAHVYGQYNDRTMPLVWAHVKLTEATGEYAELPYTLKNVEGEANVSLDLNHDKADATIQTLTADVRNSSFAVSGTVTDILNKMLFDLDVNADVQLPDADYFLPDNLYAGGHVEGPIKLKIALDDLTDLNLTRGTITGDLRVRGLDATMDSMAIQAPKARLTFAIPNAVRPAKSDQQAVSRRKNLDFLSGTLALPSGLTFRQEDGIEARLEETTIGMQLGNILKSDVLIADLDVQSAFIEGRMTQRDSLGRLIRAEGALTRPDICGYVEYNLKDSTQVPTVEFDFALDHLQGMYDTIAVDALQPKGSLSFRAGQKDKTLPAVRVKLNLNQLEADLGETLVLSTNKLAVNVNAHRSRGKDNILLEWNPSVDCDIRDVDATFNPDILDLPVLIPAIRFNYSNRVFNIDTARVELGNSNFALSGKIWNIGPWLEDNGLLTGTLNLTSSMTDVDQLLSLTSGIGNSSEIEDETISEEEQTTDADPYLVPKGVDLSLNTRIENARALQHDIHNLSGRLYIKDGLLVLEQMGFICKAARLELTAMYKTPRKNHLYMGLDYHMYDIDVAELVDLIPQVDTLLPMLRVFRGAAEFHLAAETYLNGFYEIKPSTSRGACSIQGENLTVLDNETFTTIAKLLRFKKSTENKIDSVSAEITLFKKEVDVYPFLVTMDKWMAAVGGQYMPYDKARQHNYHISLLSPFYLGVDVVTDPKNNDKLKIKPAKCKYAKDFRPVFTKVVDTQAMDIRRLIRAALTKQDE